jgi:sterol desaturase/sphingolipid hydroxylase (fatty acid hydroxylase superfamily)
VNAFLDWAFALSPLEALALLVVANVVTFALAVLAGVLAVRVFRRHPVGPPPGPLTRKEIGYTVAGLAVNTGVTVAAWSLWKLGVLVIRRDEGWYVLLDFLALILLMDFGTYVLHRLAHHPWFFRIHRLHHEYDRPRPLTLFVVHPLETMGFGSLWLAVVVLYGPSWLGLCSYMGANLAAGMLGHLGVEPFPWWWSRVPVLKQIGTSTFHAGHHKEGSYNFGFYTLIWDRLFGTLAPTYDAGFGSPLPESISGQGPADRCWHRWR